LNVKNDRTNTNQELIKQIDDKKRDLLNLECNYNQRIEEEKNEVLTKKSKGMNKSLYLLNFEFESSCSRTPQYLEFHRVFKNEFTKLLKPYIKSIEISKPNHFDVSGFFELNNGGIYYFRIEDLRWSKESMLIRTAKHFKDYTGGCNGDIILNWEFEQRLFNYLKLGITE
jgi:hypothetical protein